MLLLPTLSFGAGGYEKPALWSAKAASMGGAVGSQTGADSLYFNPAGLVANQLNLHYAQYKGYLSADITDKNRETTNNIPINVGGILSSFAITDKVTVGFGIYGLAGLNTSYDKINFGKNDSSLNSYVRDNYGRLSILEFALGSSYVINKNFRIGLSVRGQQAEAQMKETALIRAKGLGGAGISDGSIIVATTSQFDKMKGSSFGSYKLGIQYDSDDKNYGIGVSYRSPVKIKVEGKLSGDIVYTNPTIAGMYGATTGQVYNQKGKNGSLESSVPQQVSLDMHKFLSKKILLLGGINWTQYSKNKELKVGGTLTNPVTNTDTILSAMKEKKHDMYDFKTGLQYEYDSNKFIRTGFTYTNAVTNKNYAAATSAPPSNYTHYSIGWGSNLSKQWTIDLAAEYYTSSGRGSKKETTLDANSYIAGTTSDYDSKVYVGFLSLSRNF
jgi:long-subunit fatty acid transport protein